MGVHVDRTCHLGMEGCDTCKFEASRPNIARYVFQSISIHFFFFADKDHVVHLKFSTIGRLSQSRWV